MFTSSAVTPPVTTASQRDQDNGQILAATVDFLALSVVPILPHGPVPHAAMAVDTADRIFGPGAAADDVVHEVAMAPQAVVLQNLAVVRLDHHRFVEKRLAVRVIGLRGCNVKPIEWWYPLEAFAMYFAGMRAGRGSRCRSRPHGAVLCATNRTGRS